MIDTEAKLRDQPGIEITETVPKRFKGLIIDFNRKGKGDWKRVLVLETGMGSMSASTVIYELAAGLDKSDSRRIIKVGTCSGLYPEVEAGTVIVPTCALNDEGASKWNQEISEADFLEQLREAPKTRPNGDLTDRYREYIEYHEPSW